MCVRASFGSSDNADFYSQTNQGASAVYAPTMAAALGEPIQPESLQTWAETVEEKQQQQQPQQQQQQEQQQQEGAGSGAEASQRSPFVFDPAINKKISLWNGPILRLKADVLVNSTNESLDDQNELSIAIMNMGGMELRDEVRALGTCRTGDVKVSKAPGLHARYVFHTVGPRFNDKYRTAAESALFNCYRGVLSHMKEHAVRTIACPAVHTMRRMYATEDGCHIALRCIRRFLEKHGDNIDRIVLCLQLSDLAIYERIAPMYFPRSLEEEAAVKDKLPTDIGNSAGEPVIEERKIRINDTPIQARGREEDDEGESGGVLIDEEFNAAAFSTMEDDLDASRQQRLNRMRTPQDEADSTYKKWLKAARTQDLSAVAKLKMIYRAGTDMMGRAVVVLVGRNFPYKHLDISLAIAHFIGVMDSIVASDYIVVYFHTMTTSDNHPDMDFLKLLYSIVDHRYKKNLRSVYVVHPTFWCKVATWWFSTFTVSSIKHKIHNVEGVRYLFDVVSPDQIQIPDFVLEYDRRELGTTYYREQTDDRFKL